MKVNLCLVALIAVIAANTSHALAEDDEFSSYPSPYSQLSQGAVTALTRDHSGIFYNPATLGSLRANSLSGSANGLSRGWANLGADQNADSDLVKVTGKSAATGVVLGNNAYFPETFRLALGYYSPNDFAIDQSFRRNGADRGVSYDLDFRMLNDVSTLRAGLGWSFEANNGLRLGQSLFWDRSVTRFVLLEKSTLNAVKENKEYKQIYQRDQYADTTLNALRMLHGMQWNFLEFFYLGLSHEFGLLLNFGGLRTQRSLVIIANKDGSVVDPVESKRLFSSNSLIENTSSENLAARPALAQKLRLGLGVVHEETEAGVDLHWQLPYLNQAGEKVKNRPNLAMFVLFPVARRVSIAPAFRTNLSPYLPLKSNTSRFAAQDEYTFGLTTVVKFSTTDVSLGMSYAHLKGETKSFANLAGLKQNEISATEGGQIAALLGVSSELSF